MFNGTLGTYPWNGKTQFDLLLSTDSRVFYSNDMQLTVQDIG